MFVAEIPQRSQFSVLHNRQPLRFRGEPTPLFLPGWAREQHEVVVLVPLEKIESTGVSSTGFSIATVTVTAMATVTAC